MSFENPSPKKNGNSSSVLKYVGLGMQLFVSILLGLWIGAKLDYFFSFQTPLLIWILPLLIVVSSLIKIIIDTNKKNK
jgi:hypothetical protein